MEIKDESVNISYWLLPAEPDRTELKQLIARLAKHFDAPVFDPHVTVYTTHLSQAGDPERIIADAARGTAPFHLAADRLRGTEEFTKTLFIDLKPAAAFSALAEKLRAASADPAPHELQPHLSLIYKHLTQPERRELSTLVPRREREIVFNEIAAITFAGAVRSRSDVEDFRCVSRCPLS